MARTAIFLFSVLLFSPVIASAACTNAEATVVYVNGIFTTYRQAQNDSSKLEKEYENQTGDNSVTFINGYNPSHLEGAGDITQAAAQTLDSSISGFDLTTILLQVHPQITTRKVVLVGHSQGAFYSNAMYEYLLEHGEPKAAVGVYHIGSPASSVAGSGKYLTSSNDTIINGARLIASNAANGLIPLAAAGTVSKTKPPLPANITLSGADRGHGFGSVYLAEAPERVVGDIQGTIKNLKAEYPSETGECFTAPNAGLGYQTAKVGFAVADTAASGIKGGVNAAQVAAVAAGQVLAAAVQGAYGVASKLATDIGITAGGVVGISKAADSESRPTNFDILSKLYGSSLNKNDLKELLGSAVASAPVFVPTVDAPEVEAPKKIIYLTGSHGRDNEENNEAEAGVPIQTPAESEPTPDPEPEPAPEPSPLVGKVVINEVAWAGGYSAPSDQWIELYNRAEFDIDLSTMSLSVGGAKTPLSGILPPGQYLVVERTDDSVKTITGFPYALTINFASLDAQTQVSLVLEDGTVIDATPAADACGSEWCAGGISTSGYADWHGNPFPVSMERKDMEKRGTDVANWANNDGYTRHHKDAMLQHIVGTPGNPNSNHWPLVGFFCGNKKVLKPGAVAELYEANGSCTGLMGGTSYWMSVGGGVFKGQVGNATDVGTLYFPGRFSDSNQKWGTVGLPELEPGHYFVAMWEYNNSIIGATYNRIGDMYSYLRSGTPEVPGLSYVIIPFTIEGEEEVSQPVGVLNDMNEDTAELVPVETLSQTPDDVLIPINSEAVDDTSVIGVEDIDIPGGMSTGASDNLPEGTVYEALGNPSAETTP